MKKRVNSIGPPSRKHQLAAVVGQLLAMGVLSTGAQAGEITVTGAAGGVGVVAADSLDTACSLVEAINLAATQTNIDTSNCFPVGSPPFDIVNLEAGTVYTLTETYSGANGLTLITSAVTINGNGATIERDTAGPDFRLFETDGVAAAALTLNSLTLQNGYLKYFSGGAVLVGNQSTLTVNNSTISGNSALYGGGIFALPGSDVTITDSTVSANSAKYDGGGIYNDGGTVTIINSTVSDNYANDNGGGIFNTGSTANINYSTLSGNSAANGGGVFSSCSPGSVNIINSTLSGNSAAYDGGGVYSCYGLTILNSTITANTADNISGGGGLHRVSPEGSLFVTNTIISGNSDQDCYISYSNALVSNLFGDTSCDGVADTNINLDPSLQDNGGPTVTHALLAGSAAINSGDNTVCPPTDQRGVSRDILCDIGAFEYLAPVPTFTITETNVVTVVTETGASDSFDVVLASEPVASTWITVVSSDTGEVAILDPPPAPLPDFRTPGGRALPDSTALLFTPQNWNQPQTVTVGGIDDDEIDGDQAVALTVAVFAAPGTEQEVTVYNIDDEFTGLGPAPGVTVTPQFIRTTEAGGSAIFTVRLNTGPDGVVNITLQGDASEGVISPPGLSFGFDDWAVPQIVTVTGVQDGVEDGNVVYTIAVGAQSNDDAFYDEIDPDDVVVLNVQTRDDDGDNVDDGTEDGAPNGGDGNGDGILDRLQSNVTSLRDVISGNYLTVELVLGARGTSGCDQINSVLTLLEETFGDDPLYSYPVGITQIDVSCDSADIVIYYHGLGFQPDAYRNFGPTTPGDFATATWYDAPGVVFDRAEVGGSSVVTASFSLFDGELGDDTGRDKRIISRGGITRFVAPIPTLSVWASALTGLLLAALGGIGYRRRQMLRRGQS